MAGASKRSWRRKREQARFCYWCKCSLVYYPLAYKERMPDNFATIDHINSRVKYPNGRPKRGRIVVACNKCNWERNELEVSALPMEAKWQLSGRKPGSATATNAVQ